MTLHYLGEVSPLDPDNAQSIRESWQNEPYIWTPMTEAQREHHDSEFARLQEVFRDNYYNPRRKK